MHVHPYERTWMILSVVLLVLFAGALGVGSVYRGISLPGIAHDMSAHGHADPAVATTQGDGSTTAFVPGLREIAPLKYVADVKAYAWAFEPNEIRIPQGATVTFNLRSTDLIHGFMIIGTTVNLTAIPGHLGQATYTFDKPGEYLFVCHEYCGAGHHMMYGKVIVG